MAIVFQYGSNCSESEINGADRLCGDAKFVGIGETVLDYALSFDVQSSKRGCAAANIVKKDGGKVWGVLYEVPDHLMARKTAKAQGRTSFDAIEGEGKNYVRESIDVRLPNGKIVAALTYVVKEPQAGLRTGIDYVRHIVMGLRSRNIPEQYVERVIAIAAANNPEIADEVAKLGR